MSTPFLGEIITFAGRFTILHYMMCNGQQLGISQNAALFSLFSTRYGGDGRVAFCVPDLRGRVQVSPGNSPGTMFPWRQGMVTGNEYVTLQSHHLPAHSHDLNVSRVASDIASSDDAYIGDGRQYASTTSLVKEMYAKSVGETGNGVSIPVMSPFLAMNFMVALTGQFPDRS